MTNEINTKHTKLFKSLQYLRLQYSLYLVDEDLAKNQPTITNQNDGIFKSFFSAVGNEFKGSKTNKLLAVKNNINSETRRFLSSSTEQLYGENEIPAIVREVFQNDVYDLERTIFSTSLILDGEYTYEYEKETLNYVSTLLWNKSDRLINMKNSIESMYKDLAKQPLSTKQKLLLGGVAALAFTTFAVSPLLFSGIASGGEILGGLASVGYAAGAAEGMGAIFGIGVLGSIELLVDCALIGFTYAFLDACNKDKVKKSFREMAHDNAALLLAVRCYIMHVAKQTMPQNIFKEKTSELLQMLQDLKSDTDYVLLVEKQNIEENKKKIHVFHNLDKKLAEMLC